MFAVFITPNLYNNNYNKNTKFSNFLRYFSFMGRKRKSLRHYRNYLRLHFIITRTLYFYYCLFTTTFISVLNSVRIFLNILLTNVNSKLILAQHFFWKKSSLERYPSYFVHFLYVYKNIKKILIPKILTIILCEVNNLNNLNCI